jgi:hypothetical protein
MDKATAALVFEGVYVENKGLFNAAYATRLLTRAPLSAHV